MNVSIKHLVNTTLIVFGLVITTSINAVVYQIDNYVMSSGGQAAVGGLYQLQGSIGQTITSQSSGDIYDLSSGYWQEIPERVEEIFNNSFE